MSKRENRSAQKRVIRRRLNSTDDPGPVRRSYGGVLVVGVPKPAYNAQADEETQGAAT